MKVEVKNLDATIELKTKGMELEIRDPDGTFRGDLIITKTSVIWCRGRTQRENGVKIHLNDLITYLENR